MGQTKVYEGETLNWYPNGSGASMAGGMPIVLGDRIAIPVNAIADGETGPIDLTGVHELDAIEGLPIHVGEHVYWDATNARVTPMPTGVYAGMAWSQRSSGATLAKDTTQTKVLVKLGELPPDISRGRLFDDFVGGGLLGHWTKVETEGLGVTDDAVEGGAKKFAFDAVAEVAVAALYLTQPTLLLANGFVFKTRVAIYDIGDAAALDINVGIANEYNADADAITVSAFIHLDGSALDINCESDDDTNHVDATDSTVDAVDDTYFDLLIDASDPSDVHFYIDGVRVLSGTTFDLSDAAAGTLIGPMVHLEKSSDDTTADVRVDYVEILDASKLGG